MQLDVPNLRYSIIYRSPDNTKARYKIDNVLKLVGQSIGSCIRTVMLRAIPGYSTQCYKIAVEDVQIGIHSNIDKYTETTSELATNISAIRLTLLQNGKTDIPSEIKLVYDNVASSGVIKAKDLRLEKDIPGIVVKILNPEQVLLTPGSENTRTKIKLEIIAGPGIYFSSETEIDKVNGNNKTGYMAISSNYSPVTKAEYRVIDSASSELVSLEFDVETDGTATPEDVFKAGLTIISGYTKMIMASILSIESSLGNNRLTLKETGCTITSTSSIVSPVQQGNDKTVLFDNIDEDMDIEDYGFTSKAYDFLKTKGIEKMKQIKDLSEDDKNKLIELVKDIATDNSLTVKEDVNEIKDRLTKMGMTVV